MNYRWDGGGGGGRGKRERAVQTYVPVDASVRRAAGRQQMRIARVVGGESTLDNAPLDVLVGRHGIEVKALLSQKNDKLTMHPESLARKEAFVRREKLVGHTVAIDLRDPKAPQLYYAKGFGSFRLSGMERVTVKGLQEKLQ